MEKETKKGFSHFEANKIKNANLVFGGRKTKTSAGCYSKYDADGNQYNYTYSGDEYNSRTKATTLFDEKFTKEPCKC
ncbi:MAG: hypothetical protein LBV69_09200 [Bacteroidales bacterium]|jgi:hypothetical protein|nr:hypothetical protein [Bacteroidales bacterium]